MRTVESCPIIFIRYPPYLYCLVLFQFESIFDEVSEYLEDVLAACHFGIAVSLAERCHKLGTRQDKYREVNL